MTPAARRQIENAPGILRRGERAGEMSDPIRRGKIGHRPQARPLAIPRMPDYIFPAMIRYALICAKAHEFETWFKDSTTADRQLARQSLDCPVCGDRRIRKAIMAPRLGPSEDRRAVESPAPLTRKEEAAGDSVMAMPPAEWRAQLREMRRRVEADCDYVGPNFAEEARKIHYGESDRRGIYGEASDDQHRDLIDEGIEIARIPWLPHDDA